MASVTECKLIAYIRVSTDKQEKSGLGLEAQEDAINAHVAASGCKLLARYQEIESGRKSDRPMLRKAMAHAKRSGATLVIAKLDRLSRNVHFLSGLMETGVDFVCCDQPNANRLTLHILIAVAEDEARRISERTRVALAALKARGIQLGTNNLTAEGTAKGLEASRQVRMAKTRETYHDVEPEILAWRAEGLTLMQIAQKLNADGHTTSQSKPWTHVAVLRLLRRVNS